VAVGEELCVRGKEGVSAKKDACFKVSICALQDCNLLGHLAVTTNSPYTGKLCLALSITQKEMIKLLDIGECNLRLERRQTECLSRRR